MKNNTILTANNISKQYRLGLVGTGTLGHDLNRWWYKVRGKDDPYLKIGEENDRSKAAEGDYVWALQDINFKVEEGEVLGIIGKNGAGKSTLLKILSRVTMPTTGSIKTKGRIASLLEVGTGFHPELTGRENIYLNGAILGMTKPEIKAKEEEIIDFSGCAMYIDTPVKRYSSGMRVRLAFAVAAHLEPDILVVDEVLAVGDAEFQKKAVGKMKDISGSGGRTVLFVSHNMAAVKNLCTRGLVLENGKSVFDGTAEESVDFYLANSKSIPRDKVRINETHRRKDTSREIELAQINIRNTEINVRSNIDLDIKLKRNKKLNGLISITGTICSNDNKEIGSFFSNKFTMQEDDMTVKLIIPNHNLSIGDYFLNFSVSHGNIKDSNLKVIDHAYEAIGFEILKEDNNSEYFQWNKSWGNLFLDSEIIINDK